MPYLFFLYISWWGKSHPYQIFRRYYLPIFLFALSILCLGLRRAVWFRNRKSRDRQTGTVQGTEETLKKNNVSCVVSWFGFGVVSADLFSEAWRGTACMSAKRASNMWATPVDWFAFLICWFPAVQLCKSCRPYYSDYSHRGTFWCCGTSALLSIRRTLLSLLNAYWYILKGIYIFVNV